jgi:TolB-like protein
MHPVVKIAIVALPAAAVVIGLSLYFGRRPVRLAISPNVEKSIAVLPFENLSPDPNDAYFADRMQDEILTRLARVGDLKVISRKSAQRYHSRPGNLAEIAKQLGVANILEGSVQKTADQVRVNVQLINAQTDSHLWADTYDRKLTDIFGVESEIAKRIVEQLQANLTGSLPTPTASAYGDTGGREFKATTPIWPAQTTPHRGTKFSLPKSRGLIPPPTSTASP